MLASFFGKSEFPLGGNIETFVLQIVRDFARSLSELVSTLGIRLADAPKQRQPLLRQRWKTTDEADSLPEQKGF